jgi:hypothetical protein
MPKPPKGRKLTTKQEAVIREVVRSVRDGEKFSVANAVEKIYNIKKTSAHPMAAKNLRNDNFREALLDALEERRIIGADSKVEQVLSEGLDAESKGEVDYRTRLEYAKEINKIAGVYAPERHESKHLKLNLNLSKEELDEKIKDLKDELDDV